MDTQKVIEFADALCEDARGNLAKMNRLSTNQAMAFYINNVAARQAITREDFARDYPVYMEAIDEFRQIAERKEQAEFSYANTNERLAALEVKLDRLADRFTQVLEVAQAAVQAPDPTDEDDETEPDPVPAPRKRKSKAQNSAEAAAETDAEGDTDEPDAGDEA